MKKRINVIDITIALIVIAIIVGSYVHFNKAKQVSKVIDTFEIGKKKVTFMVEGDNINPKLCDKIFVEDKLIANGHYQDATITNVEIYDHEYIAAVDGEIKTFKNPTCKRVIVTIEANVNKYGPYMDISGQLLKSNVKFWLRTDNMTMLCRVIDITEI